MKVYIDRYEGDKGYEGLLSVRASDGRWLFEKLPIRSGQKGYGDTSWTPSKSPLPNSDETYTKKLYLHPEHINKNGEIHPISKKQGGIGWFCHIGDDKNDPWHIEGPDGKRTAIGIHPENAWPGSAGCPVLVVDTAEQRASAVAFMHWLDELRRLKHPPLELWVG